MLNTSQVMSNWKERELKAWDIVKFCGISLWYLIAFILGLPLIVYLLISRILGMKVYANFEREN